MGVKLWSDLGAHIPLIRSFSYGGNTQSLLHGKAPEYPLFPGEPIRYHFLFYVLVGMLEKIGLRIDWALNIPSIIGFSGCMILIALVSYHLFRDTRITLLSLIFFLFNGSLSFIRFFTKHPLSMTTLKDIIINTEFPSFAPWGDGDITAFWNLNIYTNQRHLGPAFALGLLFIGILLRLHKLPLKKQLPWLLPELAILAILPYFHQPTFVILAVFMMVYFLLFPLLRLFLIILGYSAILLILPQLSPLLGSGKTIRWYPGYLIHNQLSVVQFISYWFQNLGLHSILIPVGFILAPSHVKKVVAPIFGIFLLANLVVFSVEPAANHKFFNFFMIFGGMLSAYVIVRLWSIPADNLMYHSALLKSKRYILQTTCMLIFLLLTLSGVIDFFTVKNDASMGVIDIPKNTVAMWIRNNVPPDAVFLNSLFLYHPASLAGRNIYLGWPYFSWSAGYDTNKRMKTQKDMLEAQSTMTLCQLLVANHIDYIQIEFPPPQSEFTPNYELFSEFKPVYTEQHGKNIKMWIYKTSTICEKQ